MNRFTSDPADDVFPVWSPDGGRIVFSSNRSGVHNLYQKSLTGDRDEELLLSTPQAKVATDWSFDGRFLLFNNRDAKSGVDILALTLEAKPKVFPSSRPRSTNRTLNSLLMASGSPTSRTSQAAPISTFNRSPALARSRSSPPWAAARCGGHILARSCST